MGVGIDEGMVGLEDAELVAAVPSQLLQAVTLEARQPHTVTHAPVEVFSTGH